MDEWDEAGMILSNIGHSFDYETEKLCRLFFPFEKIRILHTLPETPERFYAVTRRETERVSAALWMDGEKTEFSLPLCKEDNEKEIERKLAFQLFLCLEKRTGYHPKWGILTGVRPAKLYAALCREMGRPAAEEWFVRSLSVDPEKLPLCRQTYEKEEEIRALSRRDSFSLYLSIPFCPTRCAYCSFVSHSVEKAASLIPEYTEKLCRELEATAQIARSCGLRLETVYMGGGTPTTLSPEQMQTVLETVNRYFDLSGCREFTVEAGRPDTITPEKLAVLRSCGVSRISINPQTMNDQVLRAIGRRHTCEQTVAAFEMARKAGFRNINMDLIAGLPEETVESFAGTLARVQELNPESVTVHALAMKRASGLSKEAPFVQIGHETAETMVSTAYESLNRGGWLPYYMYRQSKTVGNLENVGYAKPGYECLYNVYIMDETHTILSCGASAVTKCKQPGGPYIERIFNYKYPYEYLTRFDEILNRKEGVRAFYAKYPI